LLSARSTSFKWAPADSRASSWLQKLRDRRRRKAAERLAGPRAGPEQKALGPGLKPSLLQRVDNAKPVRILRALSSLKRYGEQAKENQLKRWLTE
jgi:hypothetical protein